MEDRAEPLKPKLVDGSDMKMTLDLDVFKRSASEFRRGEEKGSNVMFGVDLSFYRDNLMHPLWRVA